MKFFHHSANDVGIWIDRCHFEASHGRVKLALDRHQELANEFPEDPHIVHDEGVIREAYLGQGLAARELFERAYVLATSHNVKSTRWWAAFNAARLARTEQEFRDWAAIVLSLAPAGHSDHESFTTELEQLSQGIPYQMLLFTQSEGAEAAKEFGSLAAIEEIALSIGGLPPQSEVLHRRLRAESLRRLDLIAEQQLATLGEAFPPEERLALHEALEEIEKAIVLDPYDPVLWNFKSAWCSSLGRYSEAIENAERAIELRPQGYSRPWINKSTSLWHLERDEEAVTCAREALRQVEESGGEFLDDVQRARENIERFSAPRQDPTLQELLPQVFGILQATRIVCDEHLRRGRSNVKVKKLAKGVLARIRLVGREQSISHVPIMAQLLSDFPVEVAFVVIDKSSRRNPEVNRKCLYATQYLAAHTDGVQQRDAARFLVLNLFLRGQVGGAELIRRTYREAVLEVSAVAEGSLAHVDAILRQELKRIKPSLPGLIADQEPLSVAERERGRLTISANFIGDPHEFEISMRPIMGSGWVSAFDHPLKVKWQRFLGKMHSLWINIRGAYPVLAEPQQASRENAMKMVQCKQCGHNQNVDTILTPIIYCEQCGTRLDY